MTAGVTLGADAVGVAVRRGPGRPRDEDLDAQLIAATLDLIDAEQTVTVSRIVAASGVSRAALYRRWPSVTMLMAAALDVGRTVPRSVPDDIDLRAALFGELFGTSSIDASVGVSEARFRRRIHLVMADRDLQRTYWRSYVSRRREPIEVALQRGVDRGLLRADLDVAGCFDMLAGIAYYQIVVRGVSLADPDVRARLEAAFETLWRGMLR